MNVTPNDAFKHAWHVWLRVRGIVGTVVIMIPCDGPESSDATTHAIDMVYLFAEGGTRVDPMHVEKCDCALDAPDVAPHEWRAAQLRVAADYVREVHAELNTETHPCESCGLKKAENLEEMLAGKELASIVEKLLRHAAKMEWGDGPARKEV